MGSGAAGITLALELSDFGIDVIVLEGGGLRYSEANQSLHGGENVGLGKFDIKATRLRMWGGTTNHWGGMAPRLSNVDLKKRAYIPHSGWPINMEELRPYYDRAEQYCQIPQQWRNQGGVSATADRLFGYSGGPLRWELTPWSPPTKFGEVYMSRISAAKSVRALTEANVVEIETGNDTKRVKHLRVRTLAGKHFFVRAQVFVLATGGLEAARLLLVSNRRQVNGVGNEHDLVGRYYQDHIGLWSGAVMFARTAPNFALMTDWLEHGNGRARYTLVPRPETMDRHGMANFRYLLSGSPISYEGVSATAEFRDEIRNLRVPNKVGAKLADILVDIDQLAEKALSFPGLARTRSKTLSGNLLPQAVAEISMEQAPNPDSRVTLSETRNALGERMLRLDWRITQQDRNNLLTAAYLLGQSVGVNNLGRTYLPAFLRESRVDDHIQIASHHMGTTRMSDDPRHGVVNSDLRLHSVDNLYIASSSVYPTGGWANPTLTIVALAVRLAKTLQIKLKEFS